MHGLWNNAWFYLNGPHVLQGGPQAEEGQDDAGAALNRFKEFGLDTLAFPEYSPEYPHVQVGWRSWGMHAKPNVFLILVYVYSVYSRFYGSSRWT